MGVEKFVIERALANHRGDLAPSSASIAIYPWGGGMLPVATHRHVVGGKSISNIVASATKRASTQEDET